jgi:pimeloyl-ACP methyl ester carboxylesterase
MRLRTAAAVAATTVIGAGVAAVAAGRYVSSLALKPHPNGPEAEPLHTVHATTTGRVTLTRSVASSRPGIYGLAGDDVHAVVGEVLSTTPDTVTRSLERVQRGALTPGTRVRITPQLYEGDPSSALGLGHAEVEIPGELGPLPAWFVPSARDTWVITVHGIGTTREHPLNVMPALCGQLFPVLDIAYRNDPGAPESPDGLAHLGDTEWRDLDAAMRYAASRGADRFILYGWSTGATMALRAAAHSPLSDRVSGLVLDSPVLDWQSTVRATAAARGVPGALLPLGVRAAEGRTGLHAARIADAADPDRLPVPTLIFHGPDDTIAPWAPSRELAARRPDRVILHPVPGAPHAAMWNVDPHSYEETLRRFLTPLA